MKGSSRVPSHVAESRGWCDPGGERPLELALELPKRDACAFTRSRCGPVCDRYHALSGRARERRKQGGIAGFLLSSLKDGSFFVPQRD
jgi:hypothetical protein